MSAICRNLSFGALLNLVSSFQLVQAKFGYWQTIFMESAMFYNLPILFGLFCTIGGLCCAFPSLPIPMLIPLFAMACGWIWCEDVSKAAVVVLCLVANAIHEVLTRVISLVAGALLRSKAKPTVRLLASCLVGAFWGVQLLGYVFSRLVLGEWSMPPLDCTLFVCCVVVEYVSLFFLVAGVGKQSRDGKQKVAFATLVSLAVPVMVAGPITLMAWEQATRQSSWYSLLSTWVPICAYCWISQTIIIPSVHRRRSSWNANVVRTAALLISMIMACPGILSRGNGFRVASLVSSIGWVNIALDILLTIVYRRR
jgi:hypothetical protein